MTTPRTAAELVDEAVRVLIARLPSAWAIEKQPSADDPTDCDLLFRSPNTGSQALVLVEAHNDVTYRDVERLIGGPWRRWRRQTGDQSLLLVAPYIGSRVRELLASENISFIDLTGNIRISLDEPGVFIETQGAASDPREHRARRTALRGAKAGAVVRVLIDAAPPYSGADIARAAGVNEGYVSRILDTLIHEGLVDRERAGPVTLVDWPRLLRRRAQELDLFRPNGSLRYVARRGPGELLERLRRRGAGDPVPTVTGSFAAARLAPVAAPSVLAVYSMTPGRLEAELELLPAEAGADVVLIRPDNLVAFSRATRDGGLGWAAPSQVAIDCLSGGGRMPSEGEALIGWMREDETRWRALSLEPLGAAPAAEG